MSFQVCPICNGHGGKANALEWDKCSTCNGSRIINSETGRPPAKDMVSTEAAPLTDEKPEDIITPMSVMDEVSDEEAMYWSTPYYDELMAKKEELKKKKDSNVHN